MSNYSMCSTAKLVLSNTIRVIKNDKTPPANNLSHHGLPPAAFLGQDDTEEQSEGAERAAASQHLLADPLSTGQVVL